ncbi:MAG: portal protein [Pseudodesulfovibrio sp.]|uniref:portal protein n=1 Tax=Pseudodesulfovibrio sp. TaxID=2035812 RepID=UPI003D0D88A1
MSESQELRRDLERTRKGLSEERDKWKPHWQDLAENILPDHGVFSFSEDQANDGRKKRDKIFDGLPEKAARDFASGLHSTATSPARPWFRIGTNDPGRMVNSGVRQWLKLCEDVIRYVFAKSNLYLTLPSVYQEMGTFGTGAMGAFDDFDKVLSFRAFTIGEYMLDQDASGKAEVFFREFWMTARQLVAEFGEDAVSDPVRAAWKNNTHQWFGVVHAIQPNDKRRGDLPAWSKNKAFRSVYYEVIAPSDHVLRVSGYDYFPIMAPRPNRVGIKVYGTGPGMVALPDVKSLYHLKNKILVATEKEVDPPLVSSGDKKDEVINTMPGGISYEVGGQGEGLRPLYEVKPNLAGGLSVIQDLREAIRSAYFNDLFLLTAGSDRRQVTAREITERHEEKLLMLAPLSESIHNDLLNPLIDLTFNRCLEHGLFPPPPQDLHGQMLKVEYIDILTQAQKMIGITAIEQLAGYVGGLMGAYPEVRHKFNALEAIDDYADRLGTPPKLLNSNEDVKKIMLQEQKAQAEQQQLDQLGQIVQGAKTLSEADVGGNNALAALTGGGVQ